MAQLLRAIRGVTARDKQALGKLGEDLACRMLRDKGLEILGRRVRSRLGEFDIIARDRGTIVFVEVKTRSDHRFGSPLEAVTVAKQRRLRRMAEIFVARLSQSAQSCRFDVVAVTLPPGGRPSLEHVVGAFDSR